MAPGVPTASAGWAVPPAPHVCPRLCCLCQGGAGANGVRYVDARRPVRRVAVGGGACADLLRDALALGCDTFVTADVKYNGFLDAKALGVNLIDAGHYPTEQVVCPVLTKWLAAGFPQVEILSTRRHKEAFYTCKGLQRRANSDKLVPLIFDCRKGTNQYVRTFQVAQYSKDQGRGGRQAFSDIYQDRP